MRELPNYVTDPSKLSRELKALRLLKQEAKERVKVLEQAENLSEQAQQEVDNLRQKSAEIDALIQSMVTYHQSFTTLKTKLDDPTNGLQAVAQKIEAYKETTEENAEAIDELKGSLQSEVSKSEQLSTQLQELKKEIEKQLGITTDKTLSGSFDKRVAELTKERKTWFIVAISLLAISLAIAGWMTWIWASKMNSDNISTGMRFSTLLPLFLFTYISFREYLRIDKKMEHYAFKRTIASTVQSYAELLNSRYLRDIRPAKITQPEEEMEERESIDTEAKHKMLDFVIETMKGIYKEPAASDKILELELKAKSHELEVELKSKEKELQAKKASS